jgi:cysteine/O-acetylserine efflux protein
MEIFLYSLGVMYSPGPVNAMGLSAGLTGQFRRTVGFFVGVGCAMFSLFIVFGYTGELLISKRWLPYIALLGALYTFYLAFKMVSSKVEMNVAERSSGQPKLTFLNGFIIQGLNPKGMLVVLPVTTVMFPSAHVTGLMIFIASVLIGIGAGCAPGVYSLLGAVIGKKIKNEAYFDLVNRLMSLMLIASGILMLYDFLVGVRLV